MVQWNGEVQVMIKISRSDSDDGHFKLGDCQVKVKISKVF